MCRRKFPQESIVLKTPRKRDYNEIAENANQINFMYRQQPSNIVGSTHSNVLYLVFNELSDEGSYCFRN